MHHAPAQIQHLAEHLNGHGFPTLQVVWKTSNSAELLLDMLDRIDLTIHTPETSKAEVLRELVLLRGERGALPPDGRAAISIEESQRMVELLHAKMPTGALYVAIALRRGRLWDALVMLQQMRERVMSIYGLTRGSNLPERYFLGRADDELRVALGSTLALYERESLRARCAG